MAPYVPVRQEQEQCVRGRGDDAVRSGAQQARACADEAMASACADEAMTPYVPVRNEPASACPDEAMTPYVPVRKERACEASCAVRTATRMPRMKNQKEGKTSRWDLTSSSTLFPNPE